MNKIIDFEVEQIINSNLYTFELVGKGRQPHGSPQKREGHTKRQPMYPTEICMDKPLGAAPNSR
jgi:hypothetical protein